MAVISISWRAALIATCLVLLLNPFLVAVMLLEMSFLMSASTAAAAVALTATGMLHRSSVVYVLTDMRYLLAFLSTLTSVFLLLHNDGGSRFPRVKLDWSVLFAARLALTTCGVVYQLHLDRVRLLGTGAGSGLSKLKASVITWGFGLCLGGGCVLFAHVVRQRSGLLHPSRIGDLPDWTLATIVEELLWSSSAAPVNTTAPIARSSSAAAASPSEVVHAVLLLGAASQLVELFKSPLMHLIVACRDGWDAMRSGSSCWAMNSKVLVDLLCSILDVSTVMLIAVADGPILMPNGSLPWMLQLIALQRLYNVLIYSNLYSSFHSLLKHFPERFDIVEHEGCLICREDFEMGTSIRVLPCGHKFHSRCIQNWLASSAKCPTCRKNPWRSLPPHGVPPTNIAVRQDDRDTETDDEAIGEIHFTIESPAAINRMPVGAPRRTDTRAHIAPAAASTTRLPPPPLVIALPQRLVVAAQTPPPAPAVRAVLPRSSRETAAPPIVEISAVTSPESSVESPIPNAHARFAKQRQSGHNKRQRSAENGDKARRREDGGPSGSKTSGEKRRKKRRSEKTQKVK